jgi:hypothetical protein
MRNVRRLLMLQPEDRRLLVEAWVRLMAMTLTLRGVGYPRVARRMLACTAREAGPEDVLRARTYARWIASAARRQPVQAACLAQSLTLQTWLRGERVRSELRIGVVKSDARLDAHAWVEVNGVPVNDSLGSVAAFTPLTGANGVVADLGQPTGPGLSGSKPTGSSASRVLR